LKVIETRSLNRTLPISARQAMINYIRAGAVAFICVASFAHLSDVSTQFVFAQHAMPGTGEPPPPAPARRAGAGAGGGRGGGGPGGGERVCVCVERMWNGGLLLVHPAWLCCESGARGRVRERERERERVCVCVCGKDEVWWAMCGGGSPVPGIACCANTNCVDTSERWAKLPTQITATAPA
jgi:hypothetical protein